MRRAFFVVLFGAAAFGGGLFIAHQVPAIGTVHAQGGCDATSLNGAYGYNLSGFAYDVQGNFYTLAAIGRMTPDGNGGLSGAETFSLDGNILHRTYTGTYTVNSDCTGSMVLQVSQGSATSTTHADLVAVNNSKEVKFIQTDTNVIFSGTLTKQTQ